MMFKYLCSLIRGEQKLVWKSKWELLQAVDVGDSTFLSLGTKEECPMYLFWKKLISESYNVIQTPWKILTLHVNYQHFFVFSSATVHCGPWLTVESSSIPSGHWPLYTNS
jgi:hypothetical protein